eukprot:m.61439 g.61439  ORF g.61439 m.61439 type:complete len:89 (-) comp9559_c1_seq2:102-368(-)
MQVTPQRSVPLGKRGELAETEGDRAGNALFVATLSMCSIGPNGDQIRSRTTQLSFDGLLALVGGDGWVMCMTCAPVRRNHQYAESKPI